MGCGGPTTPLPVPVDAREASGSIIPDADCAYDLGSEDSRWDTLYACSGNFTSRPTVNGSGVLLQGEATLGSSSSNALLCANVDFTPASGIEFVVQHDLGTTDFLFQLYDTDVSPRVPVMPEVVSPSGANHAIILLDIAMNGRAVFVACGATISSLHVDDRQASGSIIPDTNCAYDLGTEDLRWDTLNACSGNFENRPTVDGSGVVLQGEELGQLAFTNVSSDYNTVSTDVVLLVDASASGLTINLTPVVGGKVYHIKKTDSSSNAVTVNPNGSQTIDGDLTKEIIFQYDAMMIMADNSNWHIL